jgi:hypothetical protein
MPHEYAGHYGAKHPAGTVCDPTVAAALKKRAEDGRVTCTDAHKAAEDLQLAPSEVGKALDLLEYRIVKCRLGLFGYSPEKRIVQPADEISEDLHAQLRPSAAEGSIDCAACWEIAQTLGVEKMLVSAACERLGTKIRRCQLGAF